MTNAFCPTCATLLVVDTNKACYSCNACPYMYLYRERADRKELHGGYDFQA